MESARGSGIGIWMTEHIKIISGLFGDYRAEWPHELFGSLFVRPSYFDTLVAKRPSLLIGGRGTGKTTTLKSLRFDAAASQLGKGRQIHDLEYLGVYLRINKNRVRAFQGTELAAKDWNQAFAHYFNLLTCKELCQLAIWLEAQMLLEQPRLDMRMVSRSFGIMESPSGIAEFERALDDQVVALEVFVNNPSAATRPLFSMSEAPVKYFVAALRAAGALEGRTIFCCLDEYENLTEEQQSIINTYVKHSEPPLTYKIGVRRNGLRTRATIDSSDQISTPDDYAEIDISGAGFDSFAREVVEIRLLRALEQGVCVPRSVSDLLGELSFQEEADRLGATRVASPIRAEIDALGDALLIEWARGKEDAELYFIGFWKDGHGGSVAELARDWMHNPEGWATRFGNYGQTSLFWLSHGRKGARIRKYYAGLGALLSMSSGNIRYFLELLDQSVQEMLSDATELRKPLRISADSQTVAARVVGRRRLGQIEGLSEQGVDLKRFVLAIGKVFFEFARDSRKSPETNAFVLSGPAKDRTEVTKVLEDGVSHLAFEATPRTKATSDAEMRDDEYRIHPIFAAFFEYSYRRKRRTTFSASDLLLLRDKPTRAIKNLLGESKVTPIEASPPQLQMFAKFYETDNE